MNNIEKLNLIEGRFSDEEAKEILMNIFSTKINFFIQLFMLSLKLNSQIHNNQSISINLTINLIYLNLILFVKP
jgi:hypothetical protein